MSEKDREALLRAALEDALEGLNEMLPYVPEFFVRKWELAGYAERAKGALEVTSDRSS
jgi:hypothetical protein